MATYTHGVIIYESATPIIPPVVADSAVQVAIGTAPVNLGASENPLLPQVAYSYDEAINKMGYSTDFKNYTLCEVIKASFEVYNVAPVIFINVLDPKSHVKSVTTAAAHMVEKIAVVEEEGILLDSVTVKNEDSTTTYEAEQDYILAFKDGYLVIDANIDGSAITADSQTLTLSYKQLDPSKVSKSDILAGIQKISQVYPRFSITPGLLLCPGWTDDPEIYMALTAKTVNLNGMFRCMVLADISTQDAPTYDKVNEEKNGNGITNIHSIAMWPMCTIGDTVYHMSAVAGAHIAFVDYQNENVPYVSPSNKEFKISGLCDYTGEEIILDKEHADLLNGQGICTAINMNGWKFWGNRTAGYPSTTDPKDSWIPVRRMFSWWGNTFVLTYYQKVDDPMNRRLIESVVDSENIRANGFKSRQQIADAQISFNIEDNPQTDLLNGIIRFRQLLTPFPPAETIINTLEFSADALTEALSIGG